MSDKKKGALPPNGEVTGTGEVKTRKTRVPKITVDPQSSKGQLIDTVHKLTDAEAQYLRSKLKAQFKDESASEDDFLKGLHDNIRAAIGV